MFSKTIVIRLFVVVVFVLLAVLLAIVPDAQAKQDQPDPTPPDDSGTDPIVILVFGIIGAVAMAGVSRLLPRR